MNRALGIIETVGLVAGVRAADIAVKAAYVELVGYELTKGDGMVVVKVTGDVGAVKAAVDAIGAAPDLKSKLYSVKVIPRPSDAIDAMVYNGDTRGYDVPSEEVVEAVDVEVAEHVEETVCNLCGDPACARRKGEQKWRCLHYFEKKRSEKHGKRIRHD